MVSLFDDVACPENSGDIPHSPKNSGQQRSLCLTRAERVIAFIERHCVVPDGAHVGMPLVLADFQREFIQSVYDNPAGTRRAILSVSRKNGKTGLIAGLLLAHLVGPEARQNSQIVSGAMSREQASLVFNLAAKMVQLSPKLSSLVKIIPSGKRLIGLPLNTEYRALAADGKTAHGLSPVLAILDEIGQVRGPQSDFVDAITTSQGAHEAPLLIAISTQAASDADLLSVWLDDAANSKDKRIVCKLYCAPPGADLMDPVAWKQANPALGIFRSLNDLREQMTQAQRMPSMENTARNLLLNQRVSTDSPFISQDVWKSCAGEVQPFFDTPVYCGLDLSGRTDLTSLVVIGQVDGCWHVVPYFWTPEQGLAERAKRDRAPYDLWVRQGFMRTTPGATVDYAFVATEMAEILSELQVEAVAYDRWRIDQLRRELDRIGADLPLIEWGQGYKDMAPALDALEAELLNGRIAHGNHPVLTMCAANATISKDPTGARKLDKSRATGRIDGLQALAQAMGAASRAEEPLRIYEDGGFTFV
jgi:phage terminase large subunit-like protein